MVVEQSFAVWMFVHWAEFYADLVRCQGVENNSENRSNPKVGKDAGINLMMFVT